MRPPVITVEDLSKTYKNGKTAVSQLSFSVSPGEVFCVVGPNGAGKTTLLRMLATQLLPSSGSASILGHDLISEAPAIRQRLSVLPQGAAPNGDLSPWDHVYYYLMARGVPKKAAQEATERALQDLDLWSVRSQSAGLLSGGMGRRIMLAMSLATGADLLVLDEPTVALDPEARRATWDLIATLKQRATILLTTHAMDEAEALADRVMLIGDGRLLALGTPGELRAVISAPEKVLVGASVPHESLVPYGRVDRFAGKVVVYPHNSDALQALVSFLIRERIPMQVQPTNLEDAYIAQLREQKSTNAAAG